MLSPDLDLGCASVVYIIPRGARHIEHHDQHWGPNPSHVQDFGERNGDIGSGKSHYRQECGPIVQFDGSALSDGGCMGVGGIHADVFSFGSLR